MKYEINGISVYECDRERVERLRQLETVNTEKVENAVKNYPKGTMDIFKGWSKDELYYYVYLTVGPNITGRAECFKTWAAGLYTYYEVTNGDNTIIVASGITNDYIVDEAWSSRSGLADRYNKTSILKETNNAKEIPISEILEKYRKDDRYWSAPQNP